MSIEWHTPTMDFVSEPLVSELRLISGRAHYEQVVRAAADAELSVWIATANLKELLIEPPTGGLRSRRREWHSVLEAFDKLAARGVELRILHAKEPSRAFCRSFDRLPRLVHGGLELRCCPRVHLKAVIVDASLLYLGSANWTGAGLGGKGSDRRNFELGIITSDDRLIDSVQAAFNEIWNGKYCQSCKVQDLCGAGLPGSASG